MYPDPHARIWETESSAWNPTDVVDTTLTEDQSTAQSSMAILPSSEDSHDIYPPNDSIPQAARKARKARSVAILRTTNHHVEDPDSAAPFANNRTRKDGSEVWEPSKAVPRASTFPTSPESGTIREGGPLGHVTDTLEELIDAVGEGDLEEVGQMLRPASRISICINQLSSKLSMWRGEAALHVACTEDHLEIVELLLAVPGIDVNNLNSRGYTPLHLACQGQNPLITEALLRIPDIDINNAYNVWHSTPLHEACESWNQADIRQLLETPGIRVDVKNTEGKLPLHYAAETTVMWWLKSRPSEQSEQIQAVQDCIKSLLRFGSAADVNSMSSEGRNPLHMAAEAKNLPAVRTLLQHPEVKVNMPTTDTGDTALHLALSDINIDYLLPESVISPMAQLLLEGGITPMAQNMEGNTALHKAWKWPKVMALLLRRTPLSVHVNMQNSHGDTVLHLMVRAGASESVRRLCEQTDGLDSNIPNSEGNTPLHMAIRLGNIDIVKLLLTASTIGINTRDRHGQTALHLASALPHDHVDIVEQLVKEAKANVNVQSNQGWTPLHHAAQQGNLKTIAALLERGASPRVPTRAFFIPDAAGVASNHGHIEAADFIRHFRRRRLNLDISRHDRLHELNSQFAVWIWPRTGEESSSLTRQELSDQRSSLRILSVSDAIYNPHKITKWVQRDGKQCRVALPPSVSRWQMRVRSCLQKGWRCDPDLEIFDANCSDRRQTRWIHLPANNVSPDAIYHSPWLPGSLVDQY